MHILDRVEQLSILALHFTETKKGENNDTIPPLMPFCDSVNALLFGLNRQCLDNPSIRWEAYTYLDGSKIESTLARRLRKKCGHSSNATLARFGTVIAIPGSPVVLLGAFRTSDLVMDASPAEGEEYIRFSDVFSLRPTSRFSSAVLLSSNIGLFVLDVEKIQLFRVQIDVKGVTGVCFARSGQLALSFDNDRTDLYDVHNGDLVLKKQFVPMHGASQLRALSNGDIAIVDRRGNGAAIVSTRENDDEGVKGRVPFVPHEITLHVV